MVAKLGEKFISALLFRADSLGPEVPAFRARQAGALLTE